MSRRRRRLDRLPSAGVLAGLIATSFLAYAPALRAGFVSDDQLAITGNELVRGPVRPLAIFSTFSWWGGARLDAPGYRPLATLWFALDHAVAGFAPGYFHALNLLLHGVVAWLLYELGLRLSLSRTAALLGAAAFCLLPIHSEAVIWAVGRAELMAAAAFAGATCMLADHRRDGRWGALIAACALLLAGLFSKENTVTLLAVPAVFASTLPAPGRQRRRDAGAVLALLATLAVYLAVRASAGPIVGSASGDRLDNPLSVLPAGERLLGAVSILGRYLALTVWSHPLSVDYSYDALGIGPGFRGDLYALLAVGACAVLACYAVRLSSDGRAAAIGLLLAIATYSIVSNTVFVIGTAMAERLFYLPTFGLCLAACPALERLARSISGRGIVVLALVAVSWAGIDLWRAFAWRTPITLFEAAVHHQPLSARAHMELGTAYGHEGRVEDAVVELGKALEIMPDYAAAAYNLGNLYARRGRLDEAVRAYENALEHSPRLVSAWYNLALTRRMQGRADAAVEALSRASSIAPNDATLVIALGDAHLALGRWRDAEEAYTRALELDPSALAARINRGVAVERRRGCEAALPDYLAVVAEYPTQPTAAANAVACLEALGRATQAAEIRRRAGVANRQADR